ncbi:hypothetical protein SAMN05421640_2179 [Ekhidna lutea]|uniref:WD40-like Beta Propeller Repeat n=1 Tax=Ekhidna lutea TaxID=447679 RepID=A0A239JHK9_EKHLU|nr:hypothetical protein [Ekhidna lutea]SNT05315.1 hypothetical protein SAMN05421640_2179 [Ekhidna lutea]
MKYLLLSVSTLFIQLVVIAQSDTEIYLMDLRRSTDGLLIEKPVNISQNPGYDNQPAFWVDSEALLYARTVDGQTEIARYYFDSGNTLLVTDTKQGSEYSPTPMPDGRISSIRLDATGLQLLYAYDFKGVNEVLVPELKIGYHCWVNKDRIAAFVLGDPATLQLINIKTNKAEIVSENIGRSLHRIPGKTAFSYLDKNESPWAIKAMNPDTQETSTLISVKGDGEDYCWTPKGEILMADRAKLFVWAPESEWKQFADLSKHGITSITRLSVSPDGKKLAIAAE